jgi:glycosyltransferase involved in cell wall biosynthesis
MCLECLRKTQAVLLTVGAVEEELEDPAFDALRREGRWVQVPESVREISPILALADILCLPSIREGMGNVLLEASAAGIPVVGTRVTGIVDAIVDGVTGYLVEPGDPMALSEALLALHADTNLRRRMGEAGARFVRENFKQEPLWQALAKIYSGARE